MNHQSLRANTQEQKTTDLRPECFWGRQEALLVKGVEENIPT